ncbi:MAG: TolC family protein [Planctomycetota bacterium]
MNRPAHRLIALIVTLLATVTGCHPTQPFYVHEDGDLSHYLATATEIENPDVDQVSLPEVTGTRPPLTLSDLEFTQMRDITLEECVTYALQNSKVIRNLGSLTQFTIADGLVGRTAGATTVYDPAIFETDPQFGVQAALSEFDAQFTSSVFWEKTDRPQNSSVSGSTIFNNQFRQDLGQFDAEISKRSASGTTFAVRNQTIHDFNNNPSRGIPSDWYTAMDLEVTQPILRGRGTQVNRAPIILARTRVDVSLADFEGAVRNMLQDIENSYWDLHFAYRFLETARIGRDSAQANWQERHANLPKMASVQEEARSREQYFFFRAQMETALRDLLAAENRLRWLMGWSATDGELLRPIDRPTVARVEFEWQGAQAEALTRTAELRRQRWALKQSETELIIARNQLLPQLDVVGRYRWLGMGDQLIRANRNGSNFIDDATGLPTSGSYAWDNLTEGRYQEVRFGLEFTPPSIGARREHANIRNAELKVARERARLEDMELNTSHLLTTALQNLDYHYQNAQTHFNRWRAAEEEVEGLTAKARVGTETPGNDLVLDSQRRRANAQADFYRSIVEYNKAVAEVHFRKGSLLEYNNIKLAEGPWPEKAYWDALGHARRRDASHYLDYGWTRPRVVSQGPTDQGQTGEFMDNGQPTPATPEMGMEPEIHMEEIETPPPLPADPPGDIPLDDDPSLEPEPMELDPTSESVFDGPTFGARETGPPKASRPREEKQAAGPVSDTDWDASAPETNVRHAQHLQSIPKAAGPPSK